MAIKIGSLLIRLAVEHGILQEGLARSERDIARTTKAIQQKGRQIADFGQKMALGVTLPAIAIAKSAVDGLIEQEKAMADVTAALTSMGGASGKTAGELGKAADALEMRSLFDAEVILKQVTAQLLTFGNVAGREFDRAQQAAVDMATRLGGEPQAAAIMLGKALNDPIKGIAALTRVGVQFTDQQKAQIKAMAETGNVAGAQGVILAEVERQFKGAAAAAADAAPWRKAEVAIGQAMDTIGAAILPAIGPIADAIAGIAGAFASLPEPAQQAIVVLGAIAAIVGPLAIGLGAIVSGTAGIVAAIGGSAVIVSTAGLAFNTLAGAVGVLGKALLGLLANPVILGAAVVIGGIYLAWQNWDKIAPIVNALGAAVSAWYSSNIKPAMDAVLDLIGDVAEFFGTIFKAQITGALGVISALLRGDFSGAWQAAKNAVFTAGEAILGLANRLFPGLVQLGRDIINGIVNGIKAAPGAVRDALLGVIKGGVDVAKAFLGIRSPSRLFMAIGTNITQGLAIGIADGQQVVADALKNVAAGTAIQTVQIAESFQTMADRTLQALDRMASAIKGGGFLDILSSVLGFGLQLGSAGVFGKSIQANINTPRIPGNANGTAYHPGGLMKVGERGPEYLMAPRGSRVVPNHELREAGQTARAHVTVGIDPANGNITAFVNGQIAATAPAIAGAGAAMAQGQMAARARRRVR